MSQGLLHESCKAPLHNLIVHIFLGNLSNFSFSGTPQHNVTTSDGISYSIVLQNAAVNVILSGHQRFHD